MKLNYKSLIKNIENFPIQASKFKDISHLLANVF